MSQDNISNIWEVTLNNATNYSEIGIKIEEGNNDTFGAGIFILEVRNDSPAFHGGVQIGDMLLAVNMCDLLGARRELDRFPDPLPMGRSQAGNLSRSHQA